MRVFELMSQLAETEAGKNVEIRALIPVKAIGNKDNLIDFDGELSVEFSGNVAEVEELENLVFIYLE